MKQEPLIPSLGEFLFWTNIRNSSFGVPGIPSDMIRRGNVVLLNFCLLKLMFTSIVSSQIVIYY